MDRDRWTFDGSWWRLDRRTWSLLVRAQGPLEDEVNDGEVHIAGRRYGATFATPEALRGWLDHEDGDGAVSSHLCLSDLVLLPRMSLDHVVRAVEDLLLDGRFWSVLDLFDEDEDDPPAEA